MSPSPPARAERIAILGGTGSLGMGLARRWAVVGYAIVIGSRSLQNAEAAAARLGELAPGCNVTAMGNADAARAGDLVVLTVPATHQISTLESCRDGLDGKLLIDVTVPLRPPKVGTVALPAEGSAGKRAQELLGEGVSVVTAFQNVAADLLIQDVDIDADVLVAGNRQAARERVIELVGDAGMTGWHAGPIENSAAAEALTSVLIQINRRHGLAHAGIKIVGN
jgi:NADPH-dependent F420 reductase